MVSSPQCGERGGPGEHDELGRLAPARAVATPRGGGVTALQNGTGATRGSGRASATADRNCQTQIYELHAVFRREHEAGGRRLRTVGYQTIDDRIEAEEALGLVDELRHSIGVGMADDRDFEPITRPDLEVPRADD